MVERRNTVINSYTLICDNCGHTIKINDNSFYSNRCNVFEVGKEPNIELIVEYDGVSAWLACKCGSSLKI